MSIPGLGNVRHQCGFTVVSLIPYTDLVMSLAPWHLWVHVDDQNPVMLRFGERTNTPKAPVTYEGLGRCVFELLPLVPAQERSDLVAEIMEWLASKEIPSTW